MGLYNYAITTTQVSTELLNGNKCVQRRQGLIVGGKRVLKKSINSPMAKI